MKLALFGATGRTGRPLVEAALARGHGVTAFVRDPKKLATSHAKLRVVTGDLFDAASVAAAIEGQDAVLSVLGPVKGGPKDVMAVATRHIVAGMRSHGVRRLVLLTGAGVAQPGDAPKAVNRFISFMLRTLSRDVLLDSEAGVENVRRSDLDWTIVRVPMLTDGPARGRYRVGMVGVNDGVRISRADVADFMLKQLDLGAKERTSPVISD